MENKLEMCLDAFRDITCSNIKNKDYVYQPKDVATDYNFLQFGSTYFTRTLSVDIDNTTSADEIYTRLNNNQLPHPTLLVKTTKGFHLHWVLELPIKNRTKSAYLRNLINNYLIEVLLADPRAKGFRRVWRNPLKHTTVYNDKVFSLSEFMFLIPDKVDIKKITKPIKNKYKKVEFINWGEVKVGERHDTLFKAISAHAYTLSALDPKELLVQVHNFGSYCNSLLEEPQSTQEIHILCESIATWVVTKYTGSSERTRNFNKKLGEHRTDVTKMKILEAFYNILASVHTLQDIQALSARKGAEVCSVNKNTFLKYKDELYALLVSKLQLIEQVFSDAELDVVFNKRTFTELFSTISVPYLNKSSP